MQHLVCLTINLIEMMCQLTGGFQIDIGHSTVLFQILELHTTKASVSRFFPGYHQIGQAVLSILTVCNFHYVIVLS